MKNCHYNGNRSGSETDDKIDNGGGSEREICSDGSEHENCGIRDLAIGDKSLVSTDVKVDTGVDRQRNTIGPSSANDKNEGRFVVSRSVVDCSDVNHFTNSLVP